VARWRNSASASSHGELSAPFSSYHFSCSRITNSGHLGRALRRAALLLLEPVPIRFEDHIALPDGQKLITPKDAADCVTKLPKKESELPEWQTAIEAPMLCSRSGDPCSPASGHEGARSHVERGFSPDRKETHWGKRKLKRDELSPQNRNHSWSRDLTDAGYRPEKASDGSAAYIQ